MTNNCNNHTTATAGSPTVPFPEECMGKLLTAYRALRNLEKLLSLIAGIDPTNGLLSKLRHMDNLLQDLSPLYDRVTWKFSEKQSGYFSKTEVTKICRQQINHVLNGENGSTLPCVFRNSGPFHNQLIV